ncbi:hypothetical protein ACH5RR_032759 [Cinchona calisaya]|uniref:Transposase n=1 Tax=Cinchona calisaya TaxID=153742 RepID=A0ABD2YNE6_9GENT
MQNQQEISSNPTLSIGNSSTPVFLDTPVTPSNENEPVQLQKITIEDTNVMGATGVVLKQFNQQNEDGQNLETFQVKKRCKKSEAWNDFKDAVVDGVKKVECIHLQQTKINFHPTDAPALPIPPLHFEKFDMEKMRETAAHWVLMHEHPFSSLEEEGFNFMMKLGLPNWQKISRNTSKADCVTVYELEKKKLKNLLKNVNKNGGIENKIFTISVDNASNNDVAIRLLKDTLSMSKNLVCGGKLFHVRCCAHILNLIVQDGLSQIVDITDNIRESVEFVNRSDGRLLLFADIVQQLRLSGRKLIYDCRTRWKMLSCAIKFKEVFPQFRDREPHYDCCPSEEDWDMNPNNSMGRKVSCRQLDFEETTEHEDNHDIGNEGGENELDHFMGLNDYKNLNKIHSSMPKELIPTINVEFDTEDMAYEFCLAYAKEVGFGIRRSKSHNDKIGKFFDRTFCCSAEGKGGKISEMFMCEPHD